MSSFMGLMQELRGRVLQGRRPGLMGAVSSVLLGLIFLLVPKLGDGVRDLSYDFPFAVRALVPLFRPAVPTNEVILIYMDDKSHRELNVNSLEAWDRRFHADLVDQLAAAGARAVVFDILFDKAGENDEFLVAAARRFGRVVVGGVFEPGTVRGVKITPMIPPIKPLRDVVRWGMAETTEPDRAFREHFRGDFQTPSLAWRAMEATVEVPLTNPFAERWINYYGPPGALPYFSYVEVRRRDIPAESFKDKTVFVGARYGVGFTGGKGKGTDDFRTPYTHWWDHKRSPGVEIAATAYLNLVRKDWLTQLGKGTQLILVSLAGLILGGGLVLLRPIPAVRASAAVLAGLALVECLMVWSDQRVWFPWLVVGGIELPVALAWSLLVNIKLLYLEKEVLERKLATAQQDRQAVLVPPSVQTRVVGETRTLVVSPPAADGAPSIPNHQMLRCIGKGAYGEVWLARDEIGSYHAVKIIHRSSFSESGPFDREFRGIQQYTPISRTHHGLVHILHVGRNKEAGYFFYIMELGDCEVGGQTVQPDAYCAKNLARELDQRGRLPVKECVHLGMELAEALHYLHSKQLIHRDIKPSNIIWVNGTPKFADVGLVTHIAEKGRDVTYLGTEGFIAPEGPGTPAADVYSLGKLIYEACMGHAAARFPELPAGLTQNEEQTALLQLNEVILKACDPDVKRRYQSAVELQMDLMHLNDRLYGGGQRAHPG